MDRIVIVPTEVLAKVREQTPNLHLMIPFVRTRWELEAVLELIESLEKRYDRVLLDCPPGINETSEQVLHAADLLVVPVIPSPLVQKTLDDLLAKGSAAAKKTAAKKTTKKVIAKADRLVRMEDGRVRRLGVRTDDGWVLIGFVNHPDGEFVGELSDPIPVTADPVRGLIRR